MRIETVPLILGVLVAMLGVGIMFDAWTPEVGASKERRRRPRIERHRNGEAMIGLGVLGLAAAFIGRDNWRYSTLVVIIGAVFLVIGAVLNGRYVREMFVNRGPLRRRELGERETAKPNGAEDVLEPQRPPAADPPMVARADENWDGVDRRQTPRSTTGRKSSQRGTISGDSSAT